MEWIFSLPTLFQIHSNLVEWIFSLPTFIPNSFQIYRHEYILCQFLCRFYSKRKMNENGMKMEWNWNEFHVLFQFYSKQKIFIPYSFQYRGINFLSLHFMPISFRFIPNSFQNTWHFLRRRKTVSKRNENGIKWEWNGNECHFYANFIPRKNISFQIHSFLFQFYSKKKYSFQIHSNIV